MAELTCIVCPVGCSLTVSEGGGGLAELTVSGNRCPRGVVYAREEVRFPKRVVTATCAISGGDPLRAPRRLPVKTSVPCPREKISALLEDIYNTQVSLPVKAGDTVIADWKGCGIDVVASRSVA